MPRVLVSDPIAPEGIAILQQVADVDVKTGLPKEELAAIIGDYDALAVRSETKVTAEVLANAHKLKIIGRAGVGVDNIDVETATKRGILVVNSPEGNTIAAAELTVAMLLALARNIPQADQALRNGEWKRSKYMGSEVYGKSLGVIGLGKIGKEVAKRAQAFGMPILGYDPYLKPEQAEKLGIRLVDLPTLYKESDYITVHVPKTKETAGMIGAEQLATMKPTVRLINCARGGIIDEAALAQAAKEGRIGGAAIDVFTTEPAPADNPLLGIPTIITTPHLGASTEEAQVNVAIDIAEQIADVLNGKPARAAVNMPSVSAEVLARIQPYLTLAEKMGSLQSQLTTSGVRAIEVVYKGDFGDLPTLHITRGAVKGVLDTVVPESVNYVNAPGLAASRGIGITESRTGSEEAGSPVLTIRAETQSGWREISGTVFGAKDIRILSIDGYRVDVKPEGFLLVTKHSDRPGIVGKVGTLLGDRGVNIAGMHVGRESEGKHALMVLLIDSAIPDEIVKEIVQIDGMENARQVQL
ncbi:MAG: phosphoglycerate dehydrogenase [Capsulimonas sp.]|uniref:phosphoglycerate dehydrogenase n=1 Tax=Capsulimonas sp. TaxID=2494211 RepID=UPI0032643033